MAAALLVVAGVILFLFLRGEGGEFQRLGDFPVRWRIAPAEVPVRTAPPPGGSEAQIVLYLDVSVPVGGFLPAEEPVSAFVPFRAWLNTVPPRLIELGDRGNPRLIWRSVAAGVAPLPSPPPLSRALFRGAESRLDEAVREMEEGFASGRVVAAALLTDLLATGDLDGALGVGTVLGEWVERSRRQGDDLHFGLVGIRAPYRGVAVRGCPLQDGLGCWLSEQSGRFQRLSELVNGPFYAVIVGRGAERVRQAGEALRGAAAEFDFESRFELLSAAVEPVEESIRCRAQASVEPRTPQLILEQNGGRYRCRRDEIVELVCPLPSGLAEPLTVSTSWPQVTSFQVDEGEVTVALDCARAHREPPPGALWVRIEAPPASLGRIDWTSWSTETDERPTDLGKTLLLSEFVERVRYTPDRRVATSSTILIGDR